MSDTTASRVEASLSGTQPVDQVNAGSETGSQQPPPQETGDGPPPTGEVPTNESSASVEVRQNTRPPKGTDLGILVTPAQAVELHRRAEEIKNGYALLAMKRLENVFAGMDTDDPDGAAAEHPEGDETVNMQLEEEKLNAALASYQTHLEDCGIQSGTPEYDAAMVALGMSGTEEEEEPSAPAAPEVPTPVEPTVKLVVEDKPLPYHDVWKDSNGPEVEQVPPAMIQEVPAPIEVVTPGTAAPASEGASVLLETTPEPVPDVKVEAEKATVEKEPEQNSTTPASPAKAASKKLPPVVRPVRGGRAGAGAAGRQQLAPKQALAPRTLALNFSSFGAGLPVDALKTGQTATKQAFSGPSGNALIANFVPHAIPSAIGQIPPDANILRGIHPVASSTRAHQTGNGAFPLTNFGGGPVMRIGGTPGGMVVAATPGQGTGKFNWQSSQQSQVQYEQARKRASVPYTAGIGTNAVTGSQRARSGNSTNPDPSIPRNAPRPFGVDAPMGVGSPQALLAADGQLPPLKSAGGMKITLQAGAAMRRTNNMH